MRKSGILLPIFSLPSPYGIGCFSDNAKKFIDFLSGSGQSLWQILPLGPTSFGDSPYQSPSAFAGNPYFIDLDTLCADGLLTEQECENYKNQCPLSDRVDYGFLYSTRNKILKNAFERFVPDSEYEKFIYDEREWLDDFAQFMAIKDYYGGKSVYEWDEPIRKRNAQALTSLINELSQEIAYHKFLQYEFMKQWLDIKEYANRRGIQIIGDMPIYTALDSAESWATPELFEFDESIRPTVVSGCPPDSFSPDGQLWGNPVYRWDYHRSQGFDWWIRRMNRNLKLYDIVRIDHFRGFESYYAIPYGAENAKDGKWYEGIGTELFDALKENCPGLNIIAEDLGFITDGVRKLLHDTGFPGMKVLQFAFDLRDESDYLPHNYQRNSVVYTGTHDNSTTLGWANSVNESELDYAREYMGCNNVCDGLVRLAMSSVSDTCIIPLQDYLRLDDSARLNTPSTLGNNWRWRMQIPTQEVEKRIHRLTSIYGRLCKKG